MRIDLTDDENALYKKAQNLEKDYEDSSKAIAKLFKQLKERDAIPKGRLNWFVNPEWNIGTKKSRKELCTPRNGKILEQPQFFKHLQYFIEGPDLPQEILDSAIEFRRDNNFDDEWCQTILTKLKQLKPSRFERKRLAEEVFKLCSEFSIGIYEAKDLRQSIL